MKFDISTIIWKVKCSSLNPYQKHSNWLNCCNFTCQSWRYDINIICWIFYSCYIVSFPIFLTFSSISIAIKNIAIITKCFNNKYWSTLHHSFGYFQLLPVQFNEVIGLLIQPLHHLFLKCDTKWKLTGKAREN